MKGNKKDMRCPVCNSSDIPYKRYNKYCTVHIPDENRCRGITQDGTRCKNLCRTLFQKPYTPDSMYCPVHHPYSSVNRKRQERSRERAKGGSHPEECGSVYVVWLGKEDYYKIGRSRTVNKRLSSLKSSNPWCKLVASKVVTNMKSLEISLHKAFKHKRLTREIFKLDERDLKVIEECLETMAVKDQT